MDERLISKKKPTYPIASLLHQYLHGEGRLIKIPICYDDLLRFQGGIEVLDEAGKDTLWIRVYYSEFERVEIDLSLKRMYSILHANGSDMLIPYLSVDAIDYCTFGNSKPFRIKVRNILNDIYSYLYVKRADASRIYGLELEDMLSPNHINYLVYEDTLIEEHIQGIPGDYFIEQILPKCSEQDQRAIAKEFVKFNERCFVRLLGDMRSYNYVVVLVHDFDQIQYRIRAIDFDQQSYEGNLKVYKPQFLKENLKMVETTLSMLQNESIEQYMLEERSLLAKRATNENERLSRLLLSMKKDTISTQEKINQLKAELHKLTSDVNFKKTQNMGEIIDCGLQFVIRNYEKINPYIIK
ncbi:MAG: hypothetical protein Q4G08_03495 [Capnocytophaga sp.]|nr:hypothetical protein [Capnocytophaga sp.]